MAHLTCMYNRKNIVSIFLNSWTADMPMHEYMASGQHVLYSKLQHHKTVTNVL